jgi:hypothetical protein
MGGHYLTAAAVGLLCVGIVAVGKEFSSSRAIAAQPSDNEPSSSETWDERAFRMLAQERGKGANGKGIVLVGAERGGTCDRVIVTIAQKVGDSWTRIDIEGSAKPVTDKTKTLFGGIKTVPAGSYVIQAVTCRTLSNTFTQSGPHALFQVRSGEFVNVGALQLSHKRDEGFFASTGTSKRAVVPTSAEVLSRLKAETPRMARILVTRPMTLIGPAESKTQLKWGPGP